MIYSLVIPTLNAESQLRALFQHINCQSIKPNQIIIIDSSSTDNTICIAKEFNCKIQIIPRMNFDHGGTRTMATSYIKSDIVVFMTQDALPYNSQSIEKLLTPFKNLSVAAVYGRQLPYPDAALFGTHLRLFNYGEQSYVRTYDDKQYHGIKTAFLSNSFCGYRTSTLEEIGYFKNNLILGEDMVAGALLLKAGYSLAYQSDAKVYHSHNYNVRQEFQRYFDIGVLHCNESWLLEEFGKPEEEGLKYIVSEFHFLIFNKKSYLIPYSIFRNFSKYIGYKLGKIHPLFPISIVKYMSMNKRWWDKLQ